MRLALLLIPFTLLFAQTRPPALENDYVRVLMGIDRPAAKPGPLHEHKQNRVMIYLDSGDLQIRHESGKVEDQHWKKGDIAWSAADGMHTSQNISSSPLRIIEIELRNAGNANTPGVKGAVLDNAQVSVYRGTSAP
ncbi:MAG: cupin domain-containing protein, partial [Acidobacteriota bacterium]|nr:cupin domain-containing protein [Acidobacteriota bacterium]